MGEAEGLGDVGEEAVGCEVGGEESLVDTTAYRLGRRGMASMHGLLSCVYQFTGLMYHFLYVVTMNHSND